MTRIYPFLLRPGFILSYSDPDLSFLVKTRIYPRDLSLLIKTRIYPFLLRPGFILRIYPYLLRPGFILSY
jgi:hypothetical protein